MAHRAGLDRLPRKIADLQRRLGLAVALADRQLPGGADLFDNFRVARLAGAQHLAQGDLARRQVLLDQHAPHRRRGAERRDAMSRQRVEQRRRVEPALVQDEDRRAGVPRREEAAIGVLRPARRRDVQMDIAGFEADPVHRRQMADRVALMAVQNQLRPRRRA